MRRRALLSSGSALAVTGLSGCLGDVRRQLSDEIRWDHASARTHDARDVFVRGGLTADSDGWVTVWLFSEAPSTEVTVFSDAQGTETQRRWDNEVHNENYETGFVLLVQVRSDRESALELGFPPGEDPSWTGLDRARVPLGLAPADLDEDELPDAEQVTTTMVVYYRSAFAPSSASVPLYRTDRETTGEPAPFTTVDAGQWTPP